MPAAVRTGASAEGVNRRGGLVNRRGDRSIARLRLGGILSGWREATAPCGSGLRLDSAAPRLDSAWEGCFAGSAASFPSSANDPRVSGR